MPDSTTAPSWVSSLTSVSIFRLMRPFREHDRREGEADAELLVDDAHLPEAVDDGDGVFAAGEELGRLAGDRREVRLGQRAQQAVALEGAQRAVHRLIARRPCGGDTGVAESGADARVREAAPVGLPELAEHIERARRGQAGDRQRAERRGVQRQVVVA